MPVIGTLPGTRLAGLSADLFHKLQSGSLSVEELALFVQRKNPFTFERNEHGHVVLTFVGLDLTGAQEIERLVAQQYIVGDFAKSCFLSTNEDSYDLHHCLVAGQEYKVALIPNKEIESDSDRTTDALRKRGMEHYGYGKPLGGVIPRVREVLSDKQMEELGIFYAVALHDPIIDAVGGPNVLGASRNGGGHKVNAFWNGPNNQWVDGGACVFPVSAE